MDARAGAPCRKRRNDGNACMHCDGAISAGFMIASASGHAARVLQSRHCKRSPEPPFSRAPPPSMMDTASDTLSVPHNLCLFTPQLRSLYKRSGTVLHSAPSESSPGRVFAATTRRNCSCLVASSSFPVPPSCGVPGANIASFGRSVVIAGC